MRVFVLLALAPLVACAQPDDAAYPRLLPLSQLNAPPAIPAHAADAAADPQAVGDALKARRAQAQSDARAIGGPVTDAAALDARARALQSRAKALRQADAGAPMPAAVPASASASPAPAQSDPAMDARIRALRDRARGLSARPAGGDGAPLPLCPPGTADPAAAHCRPSD